MAKTNMEVILLRLNTLDKKTDEQTRELQEIKKTVTGLEISMAGLRVKVAGVASAIGSAVTLFIGIGVRWFGGK